MPAIEFPRSSSADFSTDIATAFRAFLKNVKAPVKAILGPWNHTFPHDAAPGP